MQKLIVSSIVLLALLALSLRPTEALTIYTGILAVTRPGFTQADKKICISRTVTAGTQVTFKLGGFDPNGKDFTGDYVSFAFPNLPAGMTITRIAWDDCNNVPTDCNCPRPAVNGSNAVCAYLQGTWTPTVSQIGIHEVAVRLLDAAGNDCWVYAKFQVVGAVDTEPPTP